MASGQHLLSLLMFIVQNKNLFSTNIKNYNTVTRHRNYLYLPQLDLNMYQKGAYYSGIKVFNNLPMVIQNEADNLKKFKLTLKQLLYTYLFYTLEEYFKQTWIIYCITKTAYYIGISFEVLSYGTLYKYSLIVYYDQGHVVA